MFWAMARYPGESIPGLVRELGGQDGDLTFDEAVGQVAGQDFKGPEARPIKCDRPVGTVPVPPPNNLPLLQLFLV